MVVILGAFGCLITGLIYSSFSNWGFFKHTWLILKWIITVAAILFGTFFLGPWETTMMEISGKLGMSSLSDQTYLYNEKKQALQHSLILSLSSLKDVENSRDSAMLVLSLFYWMLTKNNPRVFVVIITLLDQALNDGLQ